MPTTSITISDANNGVEQVNNSPSLRLYDASVQVEALSLGKLRYTKSLGDGNVSSEMVLAVKTKDILDLSDSNTQVETVVAVESYPAIDFNLGVELLCIKAIRAINVGDGNVGVGGVLTIDGSWDNPANTQQNGPLVGSPTFGIGPQNATLYAGISEQNRSREAIVLHLNGTLVVEHNLCH